MREALDHLREDMSGRQDGNSTQDGREWERQCEVIMRANSALNITEFARMVVARARFLIDAGHGECTPTIPENAEETVGKTCTSLGRGAWDDGRWTLFALEQARDVMHGLTVEPCASHLFLAENEEQGQTKDGGSDGLCGGMGGGASQSGSGDGSSHGKSVSVILEVLAATELVLRRNGRAGCASTGGGTGDADVCL